MFFVGEHQPVIGTLLVGSGILQQHPGVSLLVMLFFSLAQDFIMQGMREVVQSFIMINEAVISADRWLLKEASNSTLLSTSYFFTLLLIRWVFFFQDGGWQG